MTRRLCRANCILADTPRHLAWRQRTDRSIAARDASRRPRAPDFRNTLVLPNLYVSGATLNISRICSVLYWSEAALSAPRSEFSRKAYLSAKSSNEYLVGYPSRVSSTAATTPH